MKALALLVLGGLASSCMPPYPATNAQPPPDDPGVPQPPSEPPPTGQRWDAEEVEICGRTTLVWVLVDDICGEVGDPAAYLAGFTAPMFRDGALIGDVLHAVDATHLWSLDISDPSKPTRVSLTSGLGQPLAADVHAGQLLLAAGGDGLVVVDVTNPSRPVEVGSVPLSGPALDVFVAGDTAYVAAGEAGLAIVGLSDADDPTLVGEVVVPGFAASVEARDGLAYVAACESMAIVDLESETVVGETWVSDAHDGDRLVAPARSIDVVGDVAFVAAGRFGAVAVDVSSPETPAILGHCSVEDDLSFYASGVRNDGTTLYVAGGEWGVLPVDITEPSTVCTAMATPLLPPSPDELEEDCTDDPPWDLTSWRDEWRPNPPPPPGTDPIQTLPAGDILFAFGDARRVGMRAVDVRDATLPDLPRAGRYEEPRLITDLAAREGHVLVAGPAGGMFLADPTALLTPAEASPEAARTAVAAAFLGDGRWALANAEGSLAVEGWAATFDLGTPVWLRGLRARGDELFVPTEDSLIAIPVDGEPTTAYPFSREAAMPPAVAASDTALVVASPEWTEAIRLDSGSAVPLEAHSVFDEQEIGELARWYENPPRRLLATTERGIVEVASLGWQAGFVLHGEEPQRIPLPRGTYLDLAAEGDRVYLLSNERAPYRSQIVVVALSDDLPAVVGVTAFTGDATALAMDGSRLYVADADRGVRVYQCGEDGLEPLGVVAVEVAP